MPRRKLIVISFIVACTYLVASSLARLAHADTTQSVQDHINASEEKQDQNLSKFSLEDVDAQAAAVGQAIIGSQTQKIVPDPNKPGGYRVIFNTVANGVVPTTASYMAFLIGAPPASPGYYIADLMHNGGFAPQAYAQGIGFSALNPILQVWKAFRNVAYFLYIIIFIVVGVMIMLRTHIDHQTVITVQAALPKLILTLILITFSYAIAGFVIDLIYLITFAFVYLLQSFGIIAEPQKTLDVLFGWNILSIGFKTLMSPWEVAGASSRAIGHLISDMFNVPGLSFITSSIAYLIIAIAIAIALFRTFFGLIGAYIGIVLGVIFSPIQLMLNAFPQANTFSSWLRNLLANAAVFPVISILIVIGVYLSGGTKDDQLGIPYQPSSASWGWGQGWVPPLLSGSNSSLPGGTSGVNQMQVIIALGMIMLLPEALNLTKKLIGTEDKLGIGQVATKNATVATRTFGQAGGMMVSGGLQYAGQRIVPTFVNWGQRRATAKAANQRQQTTGPSGRTNQPPPSGTNIPTPQAGA